MRREHPSADEFGNRLGSDYFMNYKRLLVLMAALWSGSMTAAHADPAAWTAEFDPTDIFLSSAASTESGRSLTFTLDLRAGSAGFRPGIDAIDAATLTVLLFDDFDAARETVSFNLDGSGFTTPVDLIGGGLFPDLFVFSPLALVGDGLLKVTVKATKGDFFFDNAFLAAFGDRAAVPEPATLVLFGMGLLGMGCVLRR